MYRDREIFKTTVSPHSQILKCHWNNDKECNCWKVLLWFFVRESIIRNEISLSVVFLHHRTMMLSEFGNKNVSQSKIGLFSKLVFEEKLVNLFPESVNLFRTMVNSYRKWINSLILCFGWFSVWEDQIPKKSWETINQIFSFDSSLLLRVEEISKGFQWKK